MPGTGTLRRSSAPARKKAIVGKSRVEAARLQRLSLVFLALAMIDFTFSDLHGKESLTKSNGKLGGSQFPGDRGILPLFGDVAQDQINQLSGSLIARKMAPGFEHLAQLHVQTFYRIGRVNDLSDFVGVSEKGDDLFPYSAPALSDGRELFSQRPLFKVLQSLGRQLGSLGVVDLFEFSSHWLSFFPGTPLYF